MVKLSSNLCSSKADILVTFFMSKSLFIILEMWPQKRENTEKM